MTIERTHTCGELRGTDSGQKVRLAGWVHRRRDHGGLTFVDVRDRYGRTQVVIDSSSPRAVAVVRDVRSEYVIAVEGTVQARPPDMVNRELSTGEIEVLATELQVLSTALTTPFPIDSETEASEELKFRYRYLELRRPSLQSSIALRHKSLLAARQFFDAQGFLEIETPLLIRTTPEGARDYVVPSRLHPGKFYALPQSPQIYKQILMVAGFDRYFQVARCLRDEDLRADRQPEFTQIDLEMSFVTEEDVFRLTEGLMGAMCEAAGQERPATPFERLSFQDALDRFGIDKPDLRYGLELCDVSEVFAEIPFRAFREALESKGRVRALRAPDGARLSRQDIEKLSAVAEAQGARGLAWCKLDSDGKPTGGIAKFVDETTAARLRQVTGAGAGDLVLFVAGSERLSAFALGAVRPALAERLEVPKDPGLRFCWVHRFPLFEPAADSSTGWAPTHHMFTMPEPGDEERLESDPSSVRAQLYDLVCNGVELGSGSVRVHQAELQRRIMRVVGLGEEEIQQKFGFLLQAFDYGAPPHGGIALGVDRLIMLLAGRTSLRDVIAFPKTQRATSPMDGAPSFVTPDQLRELGLRLASPAPGSAP